ncbi:MAG: stress response translation initiation inhibitor YciH [Bacteroidetes bacterium]|nr:MAG: stress response translation initiation inhibitor YciH [Bacteroidota bacterium]
MACQIKEKKPKPQGYVKSDGIIRVRREKKGRKGKTVTAISGFDPSSDSLKEIAKNLKVACGTGGSLKDGIIIIQGDHREAIQRELQSQGFKVKLSGG